MSDDMKRDVAVVSQESRAALMGDTVSPALAIFLDDALYNRLVDVANRMAHAEGVVPKHLIGKPAACFAVVNMAIIWKMSPYMVANSTFDISGKVGYEGKLVQAILENSGRFQGQIKPEYFGDWDKVLGKFTIVDGANGKKYAKPSWKPEDEEGLGLIVYGQVKGEVEPRTFKFLLKQAFPRNSTIWATDPMTQLWYTAIRRFANTAAPGIMMGVPFDRDDIGDYGGEPVDITPTRPPKPGAARAVAKKMDTDFKETVGAPSAGAGETVIEDERENPNAAEEPQSGATEQEEPGAEEPDAAEAPADPVQETRRESAKKAAPPIDQEPPPHDEAPRGPRQGQTAASAAQQRPAAAAAPATTAAKPAAALATTWTEQDCQLFAKQLRTKLMDAKDMLTFDGVKSANREGVKHLKLGSPSLYNQILTVIQQREEYLRNQEGDG